MAQRLSLLVVPALACAASATSTTDSGGGHLDGAMLPDGSRDGSSRPEDGDAGPTFEPLPDRDGDGVSDAVEEAAGTDPDDPEDDPLSRGDFVFVVPYGAPPEPSEDTLVFEPRIRKADVFFVIDTSWSMGGIINGVRDNLRSTIVPTLAERIEDIQFGVGQFDRGPSQGPGTGLAPNCAAIGSEQSSTADIDAVSDALGRLTPNCGTDEPYAQAAWLWASGDTSMWPRLRPAGCADGEVGYGCGRPDAVPIVVLIGDEHFCESYRQEARSGWTPSVDEIIDAHRSVGSRLLTFGRTVSRTRSDRRVSSACRDQGWSADVYERIATATGAVDADGTPLVFEDATGSTVADRIVEGIVRLAEGGSFRLSGRIRDADASDAVDVTAFVERIVPNTAGGVADRREPSRVCVGGLTTEDADGDGFDDHFVGVPGGTPVCFDIYPAMNTIVEAADAPQVFEGLIDVLADDRSVFDTRTVYFVVPAHTSGPVLL